MEAQVSHIFLSIYVKKKMPLGSGLPMVPEQGCKKIVKPTGPF